MIGKKDHGILHWKHGDVWSFIGRENNDKNSDKQKRLNIQNSALPLPQ